MTNEIFLPLTIENSLLLGERIIFAYSCLLHIPALYCLIRVTPPQQTTIKSYLLLIQANVILTDVFLCLLFEPIPILQVFAGYCVGVLCTFLQPTVVVGIYAALIGSGAASIMLCIFHRHQTIVMRGPWVFSKKTQSILHWMIYLMCTIPCLVWSAFPFDRTSSERLINNTTPDVKWIKNRGGYFMMERWWFPVGVVAALIFLLICFPVFGVSGFSHMLVTLQGECGRSTKLKRLIKISLIKLFVQIMVPLIFMDIPLMMLLAEIPLQIFSFDFCLVNVFILPFHPIVHNGEIFLLLDDEQSLLLGERIVLLLSSVLNIAALLCLLKATPPSIRQSKGTFSPFSITEGGFTPAEDWMCLLFEPIPIFQVFSGYCVGILCSIVSIVNRQ